ncbi:hypothetical protein GWK47_025060 [Chionoecetes opilio]|uniref:Endonuclease/exonuclease/phosphatase domain-containing protein n=1 Tax=Chionoecetes opilio TaxID=41210 RepID=A0A8J4XMX1_CHIOP|nr:hypothetical protein GWK47_025060 [Chionoecetes opilio]
MPDIILCGDFNFPCIKWPEGTVSGGTLEDQAQAKILLDVTDKAFLTQQLQKLTRVNNILDLFFTNNQDSVRSYRVEKTIFSVHNLITINTSNKKNRMERPEYNTPGYCHFAKHNFFSETINWEEVQHSIRSELGTDYGRR